MKQDLCETDGRKDADAASRNGVKVARPGRGGRRE